MERILQTDSRESQQTQRLSLNLRSSSKPLGVPAAPFGAHAGTSASVWQSPLYIARCGDVHFDAANMPFPGLGCISRSVAASFPRSFSTIGCCLCTWLRRYLDLCSCREEIGNSVAADAAAPRGWAIILRESEPRLCAAEVVKDELPSFFYRVGESSLMGCAPMMSVFLARRGLIGCGALTANAQQAGADRGGEGHGRAKNERGKAG